MQLASLHDRFDNNLAPVLAAKARLKELLPALMNQRNILPQTQQQINDLKRLFQAAHDSTTGTVASVARLGTMLRELLPRYVNKKYTVGFLAGTDPYKCLAICVEEIMYSLLRALVDTGSHINTISPE